MDEKLFVQEQFESGVRDNDTLVPHGVFESWQKDKKTGVIVPGSYKKEKNTVGPSTFLFCASVLNESATFGILDSTDLFGISTNDPDDVDTTWLSTNGDDGVFYLQTLPGTMETEDLSDPISFTDLKAVCKTIGINVAQDDQNYFVINGELDGPFENSSGYLILGNHLFYTSPSLWSVNSVILLRQQGLSILSTRTYFFKWTLTF